MRLLAIGKPTPIATREALMKSMNVEGAKGRQFFEQGFIIEGYMDPTFTDAYLIVESSSIEEARATLATYPDTQHGLTAWKVYPLVGLPAIATSLHDRHLPLPAWWPAETSNEAL
jgi:hypothetical protein